jgi:hypothetical protein
MKKYELQHYSKQELLELQARVIRELQDRALRAIKERREEKEQGKHLNKAFREASRSRR